MIIDIAEKWRKTPEQLKEIVLSLNDKQLWVAGKCADSPKHVQSERFIVDYHLNFYKSDKYNHDKRKKEISGILKELKAIKILDKKSYGLHNHKDFGIYRPWVWVWYVTPPFKDYITEIK